MGKDFIIWIIKPLKQPLNPLKGTLELHSSVGADQINLVPFRGQGFSFRNAITMLRELITFRLNIKKAGMSRFIFNFDCHTIAVHNFHGRHFHGRNFFEADFPC